MAPRDDEGWNRLRNREDEAEREKEKERESAEARAARPSAKYAPPATAEEVNVNELLLRVEPLIHQLDNLYRSFVIGLEKRPPVERRAHLDRTMETLALTNKNNATLQFRYKTLHARYMTHRERWDKILRDFEDGKISRNR